MGQQECSRVRPKADTLLLCDKKLVCLPIIEICMGLSRKEVQENPHTTLQSRMNAKLSPHSGELCPQINIHKKYHNLNLLSICYLLIFTLDPFGLSAFYKNVFDWMKLL